MGELIFLLYIKYFIQFSILIYFKNNGVWGSRWYDVTAAILFILMYHAMELHNSIYLEKGLG